MPVVTITSSASQRMLMTSWLGRLLCTVFWAFLDFLVLWTSGYLYLPGESGLGLLRPRFSTFWMGNSLTVHNYETDE